MTPLMSMTGFGRAEAESPLGTCVVEIKTVNHRFLEPRVYLPRDLAALEIPLTRRIKERLARGKVDVGIRWTPAPETAPQMRFNEKLFQDYHVRIHRLAAHVGESCCVPIEYILELPGVSEKTSPEIDEGAIEALLAEALDKALDSLTDERAREGQALANEIAHRLDALDALREKIDQHRGAVVAAYRERLEKKAEEWAQDARISVEPGRLEAEIMLFADRADVTEELVRLQTHIQAFRDMLDGAEQAAASQAESRGKPMEFLTQELLRETNTIASKARNTELTAHVLAMKNEIEKVREQVLNVE